MPGAPAAPAAPAVPGAPAAPAAPDAPAAPAAPVADGEIDPYAPETTDNNYSLSAVSANENTGAESETDDQQEDDLIESLAQTDDEINASEIELDDLIGKGKNPKPKILLIGSFGA